MTGGLNAQRENKQLRKDAIDNKTIIEYLRADNEKKQSLVKNLTQRLDISNDYIEPHMKNELINDIGESVTVDTDELRNYSLDELRAMKTLTSAVKPMKWMSGTPLTNIKTDARSMLANRFDLAQKKRQAGSS